MMQTKLYLCALILLIMKKIFAFFVITLLFVASGVSQIVRSFEAPAPDVEQNRASSILTWAQNTGVYNMIGLEEQAPFYAMQRFATSDLASYNGQQLTKIRFLPSSHSSEPTAATYSVVVYKGGNFNGSTSSNSAGTLVFFQELPSVTYGAWNTVELNTPYTINSSEELWFGVYVTAQAGYPMSYDDTTVVSNKGNVMGYDGAWGVPSDFFSNTDVRNWNIAGVVTDGEEESFIDLAVRFVNNGTDLEDITAIEVPAGQPFRPVIAIRNVNSSQATLDYTDTITITGYMDNVPVSTRFLSNDTVPSGYGGWLQISEMTNQQIFAQGYCGTTHTFSYEVSATAGWVDANLTNNRDSITVTFGQYSTLYHITVLNEDSTISPSGVVDVYPGGNQRFVIAPPEGQRIAQALADGVDVTADVHSVVNVGKTYTFYNVLSDHTFQVLYETVEEDTTSVGDLVVPEISLFPNPVGSQLNITSGKMVQKLSVYDCTGRVVKSFAIPSDRFEINVEDLHSGVYFVELVFGNQIITKKFVKM